MYHVFLICTTCIVNRRNVPRCAIQAKIHAASSDGARTVIGTNKTEDARLRRKSHLFSCINHASSRAGESTRRHKARTFAFTSHRPSSPCFLCLSTHQPRKLFLRLRWIRLRQPDSRAVCVSRQPSDSKEEAGRRETFPTPKRRIRDVPLLVHSMPRFRPRPFLSTSSFAVSFPRNVLSRVSLAVVHRIEIQLAPWVFLWFALENDQSR